LTCICTATINWNVITCSCIMPWIRSCVKRFTIFS
jgi:hypothetical protein